MPLYQHILVTLPKYPKEQLTALFRRYARVVTEHGGVLRGVENQGIRMLPERAKRKYPTVDGERYFWEARYVTTMFDASPKSLREIERFLKNEEAILRQFTIKVDSAVDRAHGNTYKNPYL